MKGLFKKLKWIIIGSLIPIVMYLMMAIGTFALCMFLIFNVPKAVEVIKEVGGEIVENVVETLHIASMSNAIRSLLETGANEYGDGDPFVDTYECEACKSYTYKSYPKVTHRISRMIYDNYTLPDVGVDVVYAKFWNSKGNESKLFDIKLGDLGSGQKTNACKGSWSYSPARIAWSKDYASIRNKLRELPKDSEEQINGWGKIYIGQGTQGQDMFIYTFDNRICIAPPVAVVSGELNNDFIKGRATMHQYPIRGGFGSNKYFPNYLDIVMEDYSGTQWVVPCVMIDIKWFDVGFGGCRPMYTDNSYCQISEKVLEQDPDALVIKDAEVDIYINSGKGIKAMIYPVDETYCVMSFETMAGDYLDSFTLGALLGNQNDGLSLVQQMTFNEAKEKLAHYGFSFSETKHEVQKQVSKNDKTQITGASLIEIYEFDADGNGFSVGAENLMYAYTQNNRGYSEGKKPQRIVSWRVYTISPQTSGEADYCYFTNKCLPKITKGTLTSGNKIKDYCPKDCTCTMCNQHIGQDLYAKKSWINDNNK